MSEILRRFRQQWQPASRHREVPSVLLAYNQLPQGFSRDVLVEDTDFAILDLETTGPDARRGDRIVSISAIRFRGGRIDLADAFHELVNPQRGVCHDAACIHQILPSTVAGKPPIQDVLPHFIQYIGCSVLVAHHAWFDLSFLNADMLRLYGFRLFNRVVDTVHLDRALVECRAGLTWATPVTLDSTLTGVAERYQVQVGDRHSSFGDALTTAQVFQRMVSEVERMGVLTLFQLLRFARRRGPSL